CGDGGRTSPTWCSRPSAGDAAGLVRCSAPGAVRRWAGPGRAGSGRSRSRPGCHRCTRRPGTRTRCVPRCWRTRNGAPWPSPDRWARPWRERCGQGCARQGGARRGHGERCRTGAHAPGAHRVPGAVLLVPVPSARRTVRARGHDPARRIAVAAAGALRRTGVPARVLPALRQRRYVADQSGLDSRQRLANLAGALVVAPGCGRLLSGGPVVLVDDLMTTGASLAEAARAVRAEPGAGAVSSISGPASVYRGETGEGRGEQRNGAARRRACAGGADGIVDVVCAAVVAASPDAFEMNRN
ncbi:LOW QUALITY PROTEIN: conserved hypothetical protein, partial [Streptomyces viridosporus ATCC 14672]